MTNIKLVDVNYNIKYFSSNNKGRTYLELCYKDTVIKRINVSNDSVFEYTEMLFKFSNLIGTPFPETMSVIDEDNSIPIPEQLGFNPNAEEGFISRMTHPTGSKKSWLENHSFKELEKHLPENPTLRQISLYFMKTGNYNTVLAAVFSWIPFYYIRKYDTGEYMRDFIEKLCIFINSDSEVVFNDFIVNDKNRVEFFKMKNYSFTSFRNIIASLKVEFSRNRKKLLKMNQQQIVEVLNYTIPDYSATEISTIMDMVLEGKNSDLDIKDIVAKISCNFALKDNDSGYLFEDIVENVEKSFGPYFVQFLDDVLKIYGNNFPKSLSEFIVSFAMEFGFNNYRLSPGSLYLLGKIDESDRLRLIEEIFTSVEIINFSEWKIFFKNFDDYKSMPMSWWVPMIQKEVK